MLNKLIKEASCVLGTPQEPLDRISYRRVLHKVKNIMDNSGQKILSKLN